MNNKKTSRNQIEYQSSTRELVLLSMFTAILFLLAFTPIGLIDLPLIKATILHVPVIIGSILLGPKKGSFLGFIFGLTSLIKNTMAPSLLSFAFSPLIPVPGMDRGSVWALAICFVPRILVGIFPWYVFKGMRAIFHNWEKEKSSVSIIISSIVGALTNTIFVMGLIFIVFRDAYATAKGIPVDIVLGAVMSVVAVNGVPEAIVAAVLAPVITVPLMKLLKEKCAIENIDIKDGVNGLNN